MWVSHRYLTDTSEERPTLPRKRVGVSGSGLPLSPAYVPPGARSPCDPDLVASCSSPPKLAPYLVGQKG